MSEAPSTPKVVVVLWEDAFVKAGPELAADIVYEPDLQESVGFVVYDESDAIGLASNSLYDDGADRGHSFRDLMFIPRGMVRQVRELSEPLGFRSWARIKAEEQSA